MQQGGVPPLGMRKGLRVGSSFDFFVFDFSPSKMQILISIIFCWAKQRRWVLTWGKLVFECHSNKLSDSVDPWGNQAPVKLRINKKTAAKVSSLAFRVLRQEERGIQAVHPREVAHVPGATSCGSVVRMASQPCVAAGSFTHVCEARGWARLCKDPVVQRLQWVALEVGRFHFQPSSSDLLQKEAHKLTPLMPRIRDLWRTMWGVEVMSVYSEFDKIIQQRNILCYHLTLGLTILGNYHVDSST